MTPECGTLETADALEAFRAQFRFVPPAVTMVFHSGDHLVS